MDNYIITFKGYRRQANVSTLPDYSGVYIVYRCVYNIKDETVSLKELLYIGQASNINQRINNHDKKDIFESHLQQGEEIAYSYAQVNIDKLDVVENALIFAEQPPLNDKGKDSFNHPASSFSIEGRCALVEHRNFTISK